MKPNGAPDLVGETRYQAGATATAVVVDGRLQWEVRRHGDDHVRYTDRLAHISHWSTERELSALRRSPVADFPRLGGPAGGTLFYPDCSNNNWNTEQDAIDFVNQLIPQGFSGMCHKVSEGDYYEDPFWPVVLQACRDANLPVLGYHYVTTNNLGAQAQTYLAAGGLPNAMFDWEANGGDLANYYAVASAFNAAGVNVGVGYCPQWYWNEVGGGDLTEAGALVASAYPDGNGYASVIYANAGGDNGPGWQPYGGVTPTCWQFTDRALIAGITVDCNAFKGSPDQLAQLFSGGTMPLQPTDNPPDAAPLTNSQLQDLYNWAMWSYALQFGPLTTNPVPALPGSPTPTGGPWPLGNDSNGDPVSFAAALQSLQTAVANLTTAVQALKPQTS
ncbi:hypothetical protein MAHJHV65_09730 [Mycobacterium avium subsp. hominissuis]